MARIRTIKPEFWTSEQIMECSPLARLLFIGLWNFCDDRGVHPVAFKTLKAEVFPADDILSSDVERLVGELVSIGLLGIFEAEGRQWWFVTGWRHQLINRPSKSRYPEPPRTAPLPSAAGQGTDADDEISDESPISCSDSLSTHGGLTEDSLTEGKGREGKGVNLKTVHSTESDTYSTGVTPAGIVCARLKSECRIPSVNPQHPKLLALLAAGMTEDELVSAGMDANGKGFAWVLAAAEGRRRDAAAVATMPNARASPRISHSDASKLAAARAIFGTEIEGENRGSSERIIDATPVARLVGG